MAKRTVRLPLGGMHASGMAGLVPDGRTRLMQNMVLKDGVWVKRDPLVNDASATAPRGLANWEDHSNRVQRLVYFDYGISGPLDIYIKGTSGETYGSPITGFSINGAVSDYTSYRSKLYYCVTSGLSTPVPAGLHSTDGSTATQYPLGGETLYSLCVKSFIDRLFLGYVRAAVENKLGTTAAYDSTNWTATNVTAANLTNGSAITSRIIPTNTTTASIHKANAYTVAASTTPTRVVFTSYLRNTSPVYEVPMTQEIYFSQAWATNTAYAAGAIRVPTTLNGFRYRVTVAGTSHAATEPVWPTTVGTTITDNTVTWICDGLEEVASRPWTLPNLTDAPDFELYTSTATIPALPASTQIGVRLKFGTVAIATYELHGVDISFRDGVADGGLNKKNKGQQLSVGRFQYPFFNQESSATATIDLDNDIYWTDTSDPDSIDGNNYYRLSDVAGKVTAMATVGGRLVVFKRRGMWVFQGTDDENSPLQREKFFDRYGCLGPRALVVFEDTLYFIGENEIYRWAPGGEPEPLCGDAMRAEIMDRSQAGWFDSTSYGAVAFNLAVDEDRRDLHAVTYFGASYVLDLDSGQWSKLVATNGIGATSGLGAAHWNANTRKIYGIYGGLQVNAGRILRMDNTAVQDNLSAAGATDSVARVTFRPLQAIFPQREISLDELGIYHVTSGTQTGSTFTVEISLDGGVTFAKSHQITLPTTSSAATSTRTPVILRQLGQDLVVRLTHSGLGGDETFGLAAVEAVVRDIGPQRTLSNPTTVTTTL